VEAQQDKSKIKHFFRQGEMNTLLKDCKMGLQEGLDVFKVKTVSYILSVTPLNKEKSHRFTM
jgi:hypothetical protein